MTKYRVEYSGEEEVIEYQEYDDYIYVEADSEDEAQEKAEQQLTYVDGLNIYDVYEDDDED